MSYSASTNQGPNSDNNGNSLSASSGLSSYYAYTYDIENRIVITPSGPRRDDVLQLRAGQQAGVAGQRRDGRRVDVLEPERAEAGDVCADDNAREPTCTGCTTVRISMRRRRGRIIISAAS